MNTGQTSKNIFMQIIKNCFQFFKSSPSFVEELKSIRMTFFVGNDDDIYEPSVGILTAADVP